MAGPLVRLAGILPSYARIAWGGLVASRAREEGPLLIVQGVVRRGERILLGVRRDLRGWELPGGNPIPGEPDESALRREIREETGFEIEVERRVGDYLRSGFAPHTARVFLCRVTGGALRPSRETPIVRWFDLAELPDTLFPWCRVPLEDAFADSPQPVERRERQGLAAIWAGMKIDVRMRLSNDRAG